MKTEAAALVKTLVSRSHSNQMTLNPVSPRTDIALITQRTLEKPKILLIGPIACSTFARTCDLVRFFAFSMIDLPLAPCVLDDPDRPSDSRSATFAAEAKIVWMSYSSNGRYCHRVHAWCPSIDQDSNATGAASELSANSNNRSHSVLTAA